MGEKKRISVLIVLLFAISILLISCKKPNQKLLQWQERYKYKGKDIYKINIDGEGLPHVDVLVNNRNLDMVFDTGNMKGMIIELDKARQLRLPRIDNWNGIDYEINSVGKFSVFSTNSVIVFSREWDNERIYESRKEYLNGSIGPRYLVGKRFTIDYKNRVLAVADTLGNVEYKNVKLLPLFVNDEYPGMIIVKGKVNGHEVLIQFDTSKSRTRIDPRLISIIGCERTDDGYIIDNIKIGDYEFTVPNAIEKNFKSLDGKYSEPVLLSVGADIISRVVLTVDYGSNQVILGK